MTKTEQALNKAREALEEAANVLEKLKPEGHGNGTIVRARDAISALTAASAEAQPSQEPIGETHNMLVSLNKNGETLDGKFKLVPVEPTLQMLEEIRLMPYFTDRALRVRYQSMLSAAPSSQKEGEQG